MKKFFLLFLLLLIFPKNINAASAEIVMDMDSGRILHQKNIHDKHLIASISKIMTAIVAIENGKLNKKYIVGEEINEVYGSSMYLKESEKISLKNLLYGLMLRSGNDASVVIANNVCKNEKEFVKLMNKKATSLKMKDTTFSNPHGLDEKNQNYSTAYDMAILTKYAMKNNTYKKIVGTKKKSFKTNLNTYTLYNKNRLLTNYKPCTGGKTGYTIKAKRTLVTTASKDNLDLVIVTLEDPNRFSTHQELYEKYLNEYKRYKILDRYTFRVKNNKYSKHHLFIKKDLYLPLTMQEKEKVKLNIVLKNKKRIKNKSIIGYAEIKYEDNVIGKEPIYISKYGEKFKRIKRLLHLD